MNRLLTLSEGEFQKSLDCLKSEEVLLVLQLIQREIHLEQAELNRVSKLLTQGSLSPDTPEHSRFVQHQSDTASNLEILSRKRDICLNRSTPQAPAPQHGTKSLPSPTTSQGGMFAKTPATSPQNPVKLKPVESGPNGAAVVPDGESSVVMRRPGRLPTAQSEDRLDAPSSEAEHDEEPPSNNTRSLIENFERLSVSSPRKSDEDSQSTLTRLSTPDTKLSPASPDSRPKELLLEKSTKVATSPPANDTAGKTDGRNRQSSGASSASSALVTKPSSTSRSSESSLTSPTSSSRVARSSDSSLTSPPPETKPSSSRKTEGATRSSGSSLTSPETKQSSSTTADIRAARSSESSLPTSPPGTKPSSSRNTEGATRSSDSSLTSSETKQSSSRTAAIRAARSSESSLPTSLGTKSSSSTAVRKSMTNGSSTPVTHPNSTTSATNNPAPATKVPQLRPPLPRASSIASNEGPTLESELRSVKLKKVITQDRTAFNPELFRSATLSEGGVDLVDGEMNNGGSKSASGDHDSTDDGGGWSSVGSLWDPTILLETMFRIEIAADKSSCEDHAQPLVGYLDRLPEQQKLSTLLKTWKRQFVRVEQRQLRVFEHPDATQPITIIELSGATVESVDNSLIGIDDKRGHYVALRCPDPADMPRWLEGLQLHTPEKDHDHHIRPAPLPLKPHPKKKVVVIDMGSWSIRAGILREKPSLPDLWFPHVIGLANTEGSMQQQVIAVGAEAFKPESRAAAVAKGCSYSLVWPLRPDTTLENSAFDNGIVRAVFEEIFCRLKIKLKEQYTVFLLLPPNVSDPCRTRLADLLLGDLCCGAVSMCGQALLALQAYGESTGVLVDLGNRTEVLPVTEGVVQQGGVSRQVYGGDRVHIALKQRLNSAGYRLHSAADLLLVSHLMRQACLIAPDKNSVSPAVASNWSIDVAKLGLPNHLPQSLELSGVDRARCTEGLFQPGLFNLDCPGLHQLVHSAVKACPMDLRRGLFRNIFLAGSLSHLPGLAARLETELSQLVPTTCQVRVHAAPNRKHAAYLGACQVAPGNSFHSNACVERDEWLTSVGETRLRLLAKWPQ